MAEQAAAPASIDDVMAAVGAELARVGVGKTGNNTQQNYKFRPIDAVLNTIGPIMARHGLAMTVEFSDRVSERMPTKSGGIAVWVSIAGKFTYRWRNEVRSTVTYGEAMDTADKATNKAMAMAAKYAHVLTFNIPVIGQDDGDADAPNGTKTLNGTKDTSGVAGQMPEATLAAWKDEIARAGTRDLLRAILRDAMAKAQEHGDSAAHAALKEAATARSKELAA